MSTSLVEIQNKLKSDTKFQKTPITFIDDDYYDFVADGAKRFYIDLGYSDSWDGDYNAEQKILARDLLVSEHKYVLLAAKISFFEQIRNAWSTIQGYTTDAISLTYPNKPWENIKTTIDELEDELNKTFYKITPGVGGASE